MNLPDASEYILLYALAIFIFEFVETYWQKGKNVLSIILYNYSVLKMRGIVSYILMHTSFIFITYLAIFIDNELMWMIFFVKILDLGYKFYLLDKISNNKIELNTTILQALSIDIGYIRYFTSIAYPLAFLIPLYIN